MSIDDRFLFYHFFLFAEYINGLNVSGVEEVRDNVDLTKTTTLATTSTHRKMLRLSHGKW